MTVRVQPHAHGHGTHSAARLSVPAAMAAALVVTVIGCGATSTTSVGPTPLKCDVSLSSSSGSIGAAGGTINVTVSTQSECAWSASENVSWISQLAPTAGQGTADVRFQAAANAGPARSAALMLADLSFSIVQAGGCVFGIQPASQLLGPAAGSGTVSVDAGAGCSWTSGSHASWITIASGAAGSGNGSVRFNLTGNTGPQRTGTLTIAGRTHTVTQTSGCVYVLSTTNQAVGLRGGHGVITVTSPGECTWTAVSGDPWITILSGESGSGNGPVTYFVDPHALGIRIGALLVAGQVVTITQGP